MHGATLKIEENVFICKLLLIHWHINIGLYFDWF